MNASNSDKLAMSNSKRGRKIRDALLTAAVFAVAMGFCFFLRQFDDGNTYVVLLFVLAVSCISRWTEGYFWGILSSFFGVVCVNYVFTYPYWAFNFTMTGYPLTFLTLLAVALMISTMTTQVKKQERLRLETEREAIRANLLRALSHDIRTPLTSIVGNTSVLLESRDILTPEQTGELLQDVNEDAQWLIRMVENILSITRIRGSDDQLTTEYEAAEEVVGEAARKFAKRFPDVKLNVEVPEEVLLVPMDITLIQQVIMNLLENAVQHGQATAIKLSVSRSKNDVLFSVSDNGKGITVSELPEVFEPRLSGGVRGADGKKNMGIGLSVCNTIVKAHGGSMLAENHPNGGALFQFILPMKEDIQDVYES